MAPQLKMQGRRSLLEHTLRAICSNGEEASTFLKLLCVSRYYRWTSCYYGSSIYRFVLSGYSGSGSLMSFAPNSSSRPTFQEPFELDEDKALRLFNLLKPRVAQIDFYNLLFFTPGEPSIFTRFMDNATGKLAVKIDGYGSIILSLINNYAGKISEVQCDALYLPDNVCFLPMKLDYMKLSNVKNLGQFWSLVRKQDVEKLKVSFTSLSPDEEMEVENLEDADFYDEDNLMEVDDLAEEEASPIKELKVSACSFESLQSTSQILSGARFQQLKLKAYCTENDPEVHWALNLDQVAEFIKKCKATVQGLATSLDAAQCKVESNINFSLMMQHITPATEVERQLQSHLSLKYSGIKTAQSSSRGTINLELKEQVGPLNFTLKVSSRQSQ